MQPSSFLLLLFLFVILKSKTFYVFAESELGLNFDPPTHESVTTDDALNNKRNKVPGDKVGKVAALALQQFAPPELVYGAVTKLMEKVDRSVDLVDSTEYTTAFGLPCNPNEAKLCFKRATTTTTTEEPSLLKQRQEARRAPHVHHSHSEPSDYDRPPPEVTDFNLVIAQAREAFDRQTGMTQELEAERRKRAYLSLINGEGNDEELATSDGQKLTESVTASSRDYKKKKSKSEGIQNVVGREVANLRGWFPDVWTNAPARQKIETARRRRLQSEGEQTKKTRRRQERTNEVEKPKSETLLSDQSSSQVETSSHEGRSDEDSSKSTLGTIDNKPELKEELLDSAQISGSFAQKPEPSLSLGRTSWIEMLLPSIIWDNLMVPEMIASWFEKSEDEEFDGCWIEVDQEEKDEQNLGQEEDCGEQTDGDDLTDDILEIHFISIDDGHDSKENFTDYVGQEFKVPTSILAISLPLTSESVDFPCFNIDQAETEDEEAQEALSLESANDDENSSEADRPSIEQGSVENNYTVHLARALRTTPMLPGANEKSESESEDTKPVEKMEQETSKESHLIRDFRQIPDFFDLLSSMFPPFLQLEELSIGRLLTTKDNSNNIKTNADPGNKEEVKMIVG